jgi:tyrosinase
MHNWVGGDMKDDTRAATDPLFWSFHAYIDLLFDQWQRDNRYPAMGCLDCAFRAMTGWTTRRVEHTDAIGYVYDMASCAPPQARLARKAMTMDVAHNTRSAAEGPLVFDVAVPTGYFRTAEIELARAELPSDFSYSGHVYLYPAETKLDLASSAFRKRWRVGEFSVWALHHDAEHNHGGEANLFVDATTELEYIQKHQPGSKWKVAVVVDNVDPVETKAGAKTLRSRIVIDDVRIAIDRGRGEEQ